MVSPPPVTKVPLYLPTNTFLVFLVESELKLPHGISILF